MVVVTFVGQGSAPNGVPRLTLRRKTDSLSPICLEFTAAAGLRRIGHVGNSSFRPLLPCDSDRDCIIASLPLAFQA